MTTRTTPAFLPPTERKRRYDILGNLAVEAEISDNPLQLPLDALFAMAARKNKKRGFLFVSKLLGKHIPVEPQLALLAGRALAELLAAGNPEQPSAELAEIADAMRHPEAAASLYDRLASRRLAVADDTLFIGFAETATALGHGMFAAFEGAVSYLHTTRETIPGRSVCVTFEEEHSHATSHRCYMDEPERFKLARTIVLVDDELTTGRTALNIIDDLHRKYGSDRFVIASLLDWRSDEDRARFAEFEEERGISIAVVALLSGRLTLEGSPLEGEQGIRVLKPTSGTAIPLRRIDLSECFKRARSSEGELAYLRLSGRFGLDHAGQLELDEEIGRAASVCKSARTGARVLCMGTGEFMYVPMRIAAGMGEGVFYQSTTRSPIHPVDQADYAVRNGWSFEAPDHPDLLNYMYNIPEGRYDELFFFMERPVPLTEELIKVLQDLNIPSIHLVACGKEETTE
ncbi:phosphoribosyltransferase family protein [Cohnella fermenti]|nr:phosphoribosyltransferase family protein [Cohnella fermenti]